jgi:glycerol-3-phosphate acyltransferase PlsX
MSDHCCNHNHAHKQSWRIAIDAMGGDFAPDQIVEGAILGARDFGVTVLLTGDEHKIKTVIDKLRKTSLKSFIDANPERIEIYHAPDEITMDEKNPARAVRSSRNASVVRANTLVAEGNADAVIAAGNTGVATVASLFELKRLEGFERPCIATTLPMVGGGKMLLIDAGSNIEASPEQIVQSALLGKALAEILLGKTNARIGLLNVGEEPGKGPATYKLAHELLSAQAGLNFVGNVEGKTIIRDICDVAVCDGFIGNIHLKALEGGLKMMSESFKVEFKSGPLGIIAALLLKLSGSINRIKNQFDPNCYGGSLLGGLNHVSLISHGSANAEAIRNACRHATELLDKQVIKQLRLSLQGK